MINKFKKMLYSKSCILNSNRKAFTLIETLVVLGILTMLASILISYNGTARQQDALTIETNKIAQVVSLAKSLTMSTYGSETGSYCGYGVYFDYGKSVCGHGYDYCIFHYPLSASNVSSCESISASNMYLGSINNNVESKYSYSMDKNVRFDSSNLQAVLFVPPQPKTFLYPQSINDAGSGIINLQTADTKTKSSITVSSGGQISFQ